MKRISHNDKDIISYFKKTYEFNYPLLKPMLNGERNCELYVDAYSSPKSLFVLGTNNWCYSLGQIEGLAFRNGIINLIKERLKSKTIPIIWFGLSNQTIDAINQDTLLKMSQNPRYSFEYTSTPEYMPQDKSKVDIFKITIDNIDAFIDYNQDFNIFWKSQQDYINKGIGFLAIQNGQIVGHAYSASVCENEVEIDLYTEEQARGQGISTQVLQNLIQACHDNSLRPKWDCAVSNAASKRLAKKFGFSIVTKYNCGFLTL